MTRHYTPRPLLECSTAKDSEEAFDEDAKTDASPDDSPDDYECIQNITHTNTVT